MSGAVGKWEARYMFATIMSACVSATWVRVAWFSIAVIAFLISQREGE